MHLIGFMTHAWMLHFGKLFGEVQTSPKSSLTVIWHLQLDLYNNVINYNQSNHKKIFMDKKYTVSQTETL